MYYPFIFLSDKLNTATLSRLEIVAVDVNKLILMQLLQNSVSGSRGLRIWREVKNRA